MTYTADSEPADDATAIWSDNLRNDLFAKLVHDFSEPVFAVDHDGRFTQLNEECCGLLGLDRTAIVGRVAYELRLGGHYWVGESATSRRSSSRSVSGVGWPSAVQPRTS